MPLCRHPLVLQPSKYLFFEPLTIALKHRFNLTKELQSNPHILAYRHFLQLAFLPARSSLTQVARQRASSSAIKTPTLMGKQDLWLDLPSLLCASRHADPCPESITAAAATAEGAHAAACQPPPALDPQLAFHFNFLATERWTRDVHPPGDFSLTSTAGSWVAAGKSFASAA